MHKIAHIEEEEVGIKGWEWRKKLATFDSGIGREGNAALYSRVHTGRDHLLHSELFVHSLCLP